MKRTLVCSLAVTTLLSAAAFAQVQSQGTGGMDMKGMEDKGMKGMDMKSDQKEKAQTHTGSGTVTKVDPKKNSVTIAHGPVQTMNWPAMTMTFKVKDKKMLDKVQQGEKVDFSFVQSGKDYTITEVK
jgi:Cu(I)/Ag(I) efflux system periplasmic protein CusF